MRIFFLIIILSIPLSIFGQSIEKIVYRGDTVLVYPTDYISMIDVIYIDSLPDGYYCGFFNGDTALFRLEINYKNYKIHGKVFEYHYRNRDLEKITEFKNGIRDGYWVEYNCFSDKIEVLHEGFYKNGLEDGFQYSYYEKNGEMCVYNKSFYINDTLIYNIWDGLDSTFYSNDTGYVYQYDLNKNLIGHGIEIRGKKTGLWKDYYENGQISKEYICDSKKPGDGIVTIIHQFDSVGNLIDSLSFVNGQGLQRNFSEDGKILSEKYYPNSNFLEYEKHYSSDGTLLYKVEYSRNNKKTITEYYNNGNVKSIIRFKCLISLSDRQCIEYQIVKQKFFNEDGTINMKKLDRE